MRLPASRHVKQPNRRMFFRYIKFLALVGLSALFPLVGFWANNLGQVRSTAAIPTLLTILAISWVLYNLFLVVLPMYDKSTLIVLHIFILFFSYGHVLYLLSKVPLSGVNFLLDHL
ncbi:MAG: hypothetical protein C0401_12725, partial [Anaerolinea sp.]|nr:hypothetical protein [Anaerolinea sp.]